MSMKAEKSESVTQQEGARRLGVSSAWLRELTQRRVVGRNLDGTYPWPKLREEYEAYKATLDEESEGSGYKLELARLTKEKADAQEMENQRMRGELLHKDDVMLLVSRPLEAVDRELKAAPSRMARTWAKRMKLTEAEAIELIEELVESVRAQLRSLASDDVDDAAA